MMAAGNGGAGGAVMITAGSAIQIGNINANGGNGGPEDNGRTSGRGGAGGMVNLAGSVVTVGLVNATGGAEGAFSGTDGGSSGGNGTDGQAMITASTGALTLNGNINTARAYSL